MDQRRVLVVDDDPTIAESVAVRLRAEGHDVQLAADGPAAVTAFRNVRPDLVVLDVMLPGRDGFELLQVIRSSCSAGVVMLTARDGVSDRVQGLRSGADDYVLKPFAMAELMARILAVLRRVRPGGGTIAIGDLVLNDDVTEVSRGEQQIELTETERRILRYLAGQRDRVVSKTQILTAVWGYDGFDENLVEVHVSSLRRKLETGGVRLLHTVRGRGYLLGLRS